MTNHHTIQHRFKTPLFVFATLLPILLLLLFNSYLKPLKMSTQFKNVAILGAGGNLGPAILNAFLSAPEYNVTVISRQESKSTFPDSVKVVRADYKSAESLTAALKGQDVVFSIVGGSALGDQKPIIDAAIAAGVKRFFPSEYGSNVPDPRVRAIVPVFEAKKGAVDYLKSKEDVIEWTSLITGPFFDWGLKVGFVLGLNRKDKKATIINSGNTTFTSSTFPQIGRALIASLEHASETKNQYVTISSFAKTEKEILAAVEKVTGDKYEVTDVKSDDLIAQGRGKLQKGDFSGIADLIKAVAFGELGDLRSELWNEKLGLPEEDFEEVVKGVVGA